MARPRCSAELDQEILTNILSRLPVKSIIQFECVSKKWSALIKTPSFISSQLHHSYREKTLMVRYYGISSSESGIMLLGSGTNLDISEVVQMNSSLSCFPKIVGSCHGLICLDISPSCAKDLVLWNPATRKFRHLPRPRIIGSMLKQPRTVAIGFGFDDEVEDYKIVRIVFFEGFEDESSEIRLEVFSRNTGSWREIEVNVPSFVIHQGQPAVVVAGSMHWIATRVGNFAGEMFVLSFDMECEALDIIFLPISSRIARQVCMKAMEHEESLYLCVYPNNGNTDYFQLWRSEINDCGADVVWKKFSVVEGFSQKWIPAAIWKDEKIVMISLDRNSHGSLLSYDPTNRDDIEILFDKGADNCAYQVYNFLESVVSVMGGSN